MGPARSLVGRGGLAHFPNLPRGKGRFCFRRAILSRSSAFPTALSPLFSRSWPTSTDFITGCGFRSDSQPTGRSRATRATSRRLPSAPASPSQCPRQVEFTRQPRHGLAFVAGAASLWRSSCTLHTTPPERRIYTAKIVSKKTPG